MMSSSFSSSSSINQFVYNFLLIVFRSTFHLRSFNHVPFTWLIWMNPRKVIPPRPAAILRSVQKDEQYSIWFKNDVNQLLQQILGARNWIQWKQQIELLADLTYYAATTLSGLQTLGEEYVRIVQVEHDKLKVPSFRVSRFAIGSNMISNDSS